MPWNPREKLQDQFELIGMDQRNAGKSSAPITENDNWDVYKEDQISLLDHLEVENCHLIGMCIGGHSSQTCSKHTPKDLSQL